MACIYLIFLLKAETSQCIENGFLYASKKQISGDVMCSCSVQQPDGSIGLFEFNETEMHIIPTEQPQYAFKP